MNVYDSNRIVDALSTDIVSERVDSIDDADIIVLNTCAIREKAEEKVFSELGRIRKRTKGKHVTIAVGGCVASQYGDTIKKRAPYVDIIFGPQTIHRLPELYKRQSAGIPCVDVTFPEIEKFDNLPKPHATGVSGFVSIMEGCSKFCSYCVVPYTRGKEVSRPLPSIIEEVQHLADQGVREVNLLGQNVNAYRHDGADMADVIRAVALLAGIARIRFTTSHPKEMSQRIVDVYKDVPKLVSHLHLPVQSGSNTILQAMKRGYTREIYLDLLERIRQARPDIQMSSDFIVGFPNESEAEFMQTIDLIERIGFDISYSFIFSPRPGTPAALLADSTSAATKKQRLRHLQNILNSQAAAISSAMVGSTQSILVNDFSKKNLSHLQGRTTNNRIVNFASDDMTLIGQIVDVQIITAKPNSFWGELA